MPASAKRRAASTAPIALVSAQPATATLPSRGSMAGKRIIGRSFRRLVEALVIVMSGYDTPLDLGVPWVSAPAAIAEPLIKPDRGALGIAQIEVEHRQSELLGQAFELADDAAA